MDLDMPNGRSSERNGTKQEHISNDILRVLEDKRRQLHEEIEEFKAHKEAEYRDYERRLRSERLEADKVVVTSQVGETEAQTVEDPGKEVIDSLSPPDRSNAARRAARRTRTARQALSQAFGGSPGPPDKGKEHEREKEFEGVFTPEYLGLINGDSTPRNGHLHPGTIAAPPLQLSSSASSNPPNPLISPPSLSSSAPTQSVAQTHYRSDSSNSLLSVSSLRSSMKDPNTPKSPKRVLFSIEDGVVVSPSTSPIIVRKPSAEEGGEFGGDSVRVGSMLELGKKIKRKKNRRKERGGEESRGRHLVREELEDIGLSEGRGFMNLNEGWTRSVPTFSRADFDASNIAALPNLTATTDDFEKVEKGEEDDMFTFDEDLEAGAAAKDQTNDEAVSGDLSDEDDVAKEALPGTSPHAGSLPIEIKWPGRRDSGG